MLEIIQSYAFWLGLLAATIRVAMPIYLAAIGEIFSERSGIINIGIEGQMLVGALFSFVAAFYSGNLWLGVLAGCLTGMALALLSAYLCVSRLANQIVVGIVINVFALGLTTFWSRVIFGITAAPPSIQTFRPIAIPLLSRIPYLGPILFNQNILVYLGILIGVVATIVIFKTSWGLNLRSVGEHPRAADTMGVNVTFVKYCSLMIGGAMAGLGGSFLSLVILGRFVENITAGRGFIALAIVIFGRWNPIFALGAALLFGVVEAFQLRVQAMGVRIPYQLLLMLPHLLTVIIVPIASRKVFGPASLGKPYSKE